MTHRFAQLVIPVNDLDQSKELYRTLLGVEPYADAAFYVGFRADDLEIGLDPNGAKKGMKGPVGFWDVDDIKGSVQQLVGAGGQVQQDVKDVGGGMLTAMVTDTDGNVIGLRQAG